MEIATKIKNLLSMKDIAIKYDFPINNKNFICCPFHNEKTASLKIYPGDKGWHCFGCGEGGSVIDFVMKLYDIKFMDVCKKIDNDFQLGIIKEYKQNPQNIKMMSDRYRKKKLKEYKKSEIVKEYEHYKNQYNDILNKASESNNFQSIEELPDDVIEAIKDLCLIEYYCDCAENDAIPIMQKERNIEIKKYEQEYGAIIGDLVYGAVNGLFTEQLVKEDTKYYLDHADEELRRLEK